MTRRVNAAVLRRPAFTLVEVLLALAVSTLVGAALVMMLHAIGTATRAETDSRRDTVRELVAATRLGTLVRGSAVVLYHDETQLMLWRGDLNGNDRPDLSELRLLRWEADVGQIWTFEALSGLSPASDVTYNLLDDFGAIADGVAGTSAFPGALAIQHVTSFGVLHDGPIAQAARIVRLDLTIEGERGVWSSAIVASLRASI